MELQSMELLCILIYKYIWVISANNKYWLELL
jgi:hypothetical protein